MLTDETALKRAREIAGKTVGVIAAALLAVQTETARECLAALTDTGDDYYSPADENIAKEKVRAKFLEEK
jgi:hypothetical protein